MTNHNKRFIIIVSLVAVLSLLSAIIAIIIFYPRYQNISVFDELSLSTQHLAEDNIELAKKISELREEKEILTQNQVRKGDQDTLSHLESLVGVKQTHGQGAIITLDNQLSNSEYDNSLLCHGANIRDILNILHLPQLEVEGISINGVRMHMQSGINCFSDGIAVGTTKLFAPYEIQVVGIPRQIINTLKTKTLAPELWKQVENQQVILDIEESQEVILQASTSTPSTNFIQSYNDIDT